MSNQNTCLTLQMKVDIGMPVQITSTFLKCCLHWQRRRRRRYDPENRGFKKFVFYNHNIIVITVFKSRNQAHGLMFVFIKQRIRHL